MAVGVLLSINTSNGGVPKHPRPEARIAATGVEGDRQRDRRHHGGPERAVCLYSFDRLRELQHEGHDVTVGALGENLTVAGMDWRLCVPGARLRVGDAELVITSFAVPCRNLSACFSGGAVARVSQKMHPGWSRAYARVTREGTVHLGDRVELVETAPHEGREARAADPPATRLLRTGEFSLWASMDRVFPLFTPDGERLWVPDFDPEYLHPRSGDADTGAIFLTRHGGEETFWMVQQLSPLLGFAEYFRATPGSRRGTVRVQLTAAEPETTRVAVTYDLIAVSPVGEAKLASFGEQFPSMLEDWQEKLARYLTSDAFE